ncbi:MAG: BON domain-containing protein [Acidobacteria bacterium]|nr:BON domain-containing protein [Acidobacteriota bacterium]
MHRSVSILLAVFLTALLSNTAATTAATQDKQKPRQNTREFLIKEVRHQLVLMPYYSLFDWFEFEIQDEDTVILRGQTIRPTLKSEAEARVREIEGVEKVINEIEVLPLSPNDDRIRRAVYRAIYNYNSPLFRYATQVVPSIHIIVKNGRVTLKGVVANKGDSDLANIKANGVSGVFEVKNELRVEKSEKK